MKEYQRLRLELLELDEEDIVTESSEGDKYDDGWKDPNWQ